VELRWVTREAAGGLKAPGESGDELGFYQPTRTTQIYMIVNRVEYKRDNHHYVSRLHKRHENTVGFGGDRRDSNEWRGRRTAVIMHEREATEIKDTV
jgi:hypothetical protein